MTAASNGGGAPTPPVAEKRPHQDTRHGITRTDEYAWLRADNWQEVMRAPDALPADIRAYLEAENEYCRSALADTEALQESLFAELKGRIKEDDSSVPAPDGPFVYYSSFVTGGQHPLVCRKPRDGGAEHVLLDGNKLAEDQAYFSLGGVAHSPNHELLSYSSDTKGSELYTIRVRRADSLEELSDEVPDTSGGMVWSGDGSSLFYVRMDENHRPRQVYRHVLGTPAAEDQLVYDEPDIGFYVGVSATQDHRYIVISAHDHQTAEVHLVDAMDPGSPPVLIAERETEHEYSVDHHDGRLIILTNSGGAEDFRIVETPVDAPGRENWRDIEPYREGRLILSIVAFQRHLVRLEREEGLPRIVIREFASGDEHAIAFDEEAYSLGMSAGYEFDTNMLRFTYSSMTTPAQVFDYDMDSRERTLRKTQEVPSGHNPTDYVTRRVMAPAKDGETVPVSLLYRRDTPLDGSAPLLLYGYGSYGISIPASFSSNCLSLVDRGFVYAIAHIRGGMDKGYHWYREGRLANKMNTFTDFIAAGEYLAERKFTTRGSIVAHGGSAGGLLMGAVANLAPDLFKGIIAEVAFVDVLNTILDDTLPLTPPEWLEWGNPITSAEQYGWIASWSPYDNIRDQDYPHILALAGLTDPRVTYWEPAKWIARLRAHKTDDNLALLKVNMEAGHGGASGRFDRLKEVAIADAFALKITGRMDVEPARPSV